MRKQRKKHELEIYYSKYQIIKKEFQNSSLSAYAGQSAYMLMLSFFPFVMFITALLKYTPLSQKLLASALEAMIPSSFHDFISGLISQIYQSQSQSLVPLSVITALWLGSKAFLSLIQGFNAVYNIKETRHYFVLRIVSLLYTLIFALLIILILTILVFGNFLYEHLKIVFSILENTVLSSISFRSLGSFFTMFVLFTFLYKNIPNRKLRFSEQFPGALLATVGWMGFSFLYSIYMDHISNYASFYGTMTMIALLMVWLYACMYLLFVGLFLNCYLLKSGYFVEDTRQPEK